MRLALLILVAAALVALAAARPITAATATPPGWKWGDDGIS
jgi:hypothetical protein